MINRGPPGEELSVDDHDLRRAFQATNRKKKCKSPHQQKMVPVPTSNQFQVLGELANDLNLSLHKTHNTNRVRSTRYYQPTRKGEPLSQGTITNVDLHSEAPPSRRVKHAQMPLKFWWRNLNSTNQEKPLKREQEGSHLLP